MDEIEQIKAEVESLQESLAIADLMSSRWGAGGLEFLLNKLQNLRIRMDSSQNHNRPHIHIDYGKLRHVISISIRDGVVLAGKLPPRQLNVVLRWIEKNQDLLLVIWNSLLQSQNPVFLLQQLVD